MKAAFDTGAAAAATAMQQCEFPLELVPLDDDVLSLELDDAFR